MNKWTKIGLAVGISSAAIGTVHVINRLIFSSATANMITDINDKKTFTWKFGDISYTVRGEGTPLLLIHDLQSTSSSYEWKNVINHFSKNHKVYAIDLLGCGFSDKPNITYTTYMYTQLLNDFITNIIGCKTDVISTGNSAPLTIMTAYNNNEIFNKIILINPESIKDSMKNPDKYSNIRRKLLNSPILGTMLYNICMGRNKTRQHFTNHLFFNKNKVTQELVDAYHENSHLYGSSAKYLYTSTVCHYTTASIATAISKLDNCIYIINGKDNKNSVLNANEYIGLNPAIEVAYIDRTKHLPHLEQPVKFTKTADIFLA